MGLAKDMGDAHEEFLADLFEGRQTRGSGNQWANPIDGRQSRSHVAYAFAWDGKSTHGKSIGVSLAMWDKAREQAGGNRPMLGLRFYADGKLRVTRDLVVLDAHDLAEILQAANQMAVIQEVGCLEGVHEHEPVESDSVPGMFIKRGACRGCGRWPYEASREGAS